MEEVEGIPGQLPPLAPFPAPETRQNLPPEEWQACLNAWVFCVEFRLRLLPEHFHHFKLSQSSSGTFFLSSYFLSCNSGHDSSGSYRPRDVKEQKLHRRCLLLLRRLLLETDTPYDYPARDLFFLLANASAASGMSKLWNDTLQETWLGRENQISAALEETRSYLIKIIGVGGTDSYKILGRSLRQVTALSKSLPQAGKIMMTGYDYVDSLTTTYNDLPGKLNAANMKDLRKLLTENLFICLRSLTASPNLAPSLLLDDLYGLKANAEAEAKVNPNRPTLLSSLVCSTSFNRHLEAFLATSSNSRGESVAQFLRSYKTKMAYLHPIARTRIYRQRKEKSKSIAAHSVHEMHVHMAAQLSQIHELFPHTPTSYVLRLLDYFSDDVEAVTAALLEPGSLPAKLQDPQSFADDVDTAPAIQPELAPRSTPPSIPNRKNVFDHDDFDELRISMSQVHIGRKERNNLEQSDPSGKAKKKAAIMAALAAFDSDDDERDDTYDVADVGGAVDSTVDTDARPRGRTIKEPEEMSVNEQILFNAWRSQPEMFARESKTRMSKPRQQLKSETGMSDEQIEGFAVMLSRDEASVQKLENMYVGPASFGGRQKALRTTKWSASRSGTATEEDTDTEGGSGDGPDRRGASSRSRPFRGGRGIGRPRGRTSGPASEVGNQNARKRKEQGRGGDGANHNRREGRARKMGTGFGSLPPPG